MTSQNDKPKKARTRRRRFPKGGPTKTELKGFRETLLGLRAGILRSSQNLADEVLKGSGQDFSVDHMADHGTDNFDQEFSLALLEGETEIIRDIDDALQKIDGKGELPYGACETCAEDEAPDEEGGSADGANARWPWIVKGRLRAVPYARLCVGHKEREEEGQA